MVSIDWSSAIGVVLVGGGVIMGLVTGVIALVKNRASLKKLWPGSESAAVAPVVQPGERTVVVRLSNESPKRGADEPAPPGAVAWVTDIVDAMGGAKAESKLAALNGGESRDQARSRRIKELELGVPPVATEAMVEA